jgi:DNA/RNA-binding domain of Phe-tRNA-synthetase-like protein
VIQTRVHPDVFTAHPLFRRGIVFACGLDNAGGSDELAALLERAVAARAASPVDLTADPRVQAWAEAHRRFGSNPNKFPPAHVSLLKRVQRPEARIPFINKVVAVMNVCSLEAATPVGGDQVASGTLELRPAAGGERFAPLGEPQTIEHPVPGEIIYVVDETGDVMCRRWNWRNGHLTRITETTTTIMMNIDAIGDGSEQHAAVTRNRVAELLARYCGARVETGMLSPAAPSLRFGA